jgi:hypothetical protein
MDLTSAEEDIMILLLICNNLLNSHIDVTVPHNKTDVKVSFGSTLDEEPCNESFGIDDVMIYVR